VPRATRTPRKFGRCASFKGHFLAPCQTQTEQSLKSASPHRLLLGLSLGVLNLPRKVWHESLLTGLTPPHPPPTGIGVECSEARLAARDDVGVFHVTHTTVSGVLLCWGSTTAHAGVVCGATRHVAPFHCLAPGVLPREV
jgi:hypothetical protein